MTWMSPVYPTAKRGIDVACALLAMTILALPAMCIAAIVKLTSAGPVFYWSQRVGRQNRLFWMPKFRSMSVGTPEVATDLLTDSKNWITPVGQILRKTSLDELPQLWCILKGDMSFVGPRPALHNQDYLIDTRTRAGVHTLTPGLTGWAQINGRDELAIPQKVELDAEYLQLRSLLFDLRVIALTVHRVIVAEGVKQADPVIIARPTETRRAA